VGRRWDDATGVVTPEAVTLEFAEANVGSRSVAVLLDLLVLWTAFSILFTAFSFLFFAGIGATGTEPPVWVVVVLVVLVNLGLLFGYPIGFETLTRGRTLGKMAMGLRVVTVEGSPIGFRHAAIRAALGLVDFYGTVGIAAVLSTLLSRRHQRLGDRVAGTVVVRERSSGPRPEALQFSVPPGAEPYAGTLDPSALSARDYDLVRSFLLRAPALETSRRDDLGRRLAGVLARRMAHRPPSWVSPELFLVCLMARHQQQQPAAAVGAGVRDGREQPDQGNGDEQWGDFSPPSAPHGDAAS